MRISVNNRFAKQENISGVVVTKATKERRELSTSDIMVKTNGGSKSDDDPCASGGSKSF